ncbi:hypothetical protein AVEN_17433-1, partial [Araneus ventricosus]
DGCWGAQPPQVAYPRSGMALRWLSFAMNVLNRRGSVKELERDLAATYKDRQQSNQQDNSSTLQQKSGEGKSAGPIKKERGEARQKTLSDDSLLVCDLVFMPLSTGSGVT